MKLTQQIGTVMNADETDAIQPLQHGQGCLSIECIGMQPNQPNIEWTEPKPFQAFRLA